MDGKKSDRKTNNNVVERVKSCDEWDGEQREKGGRSVVADCAALLAIGAHPGPAHLDMSFRWADGDSDPAFRRDVENLL